MFVKPAPGLKVRDPVTRMHLPENGAEVPESQHWHRRLACGDVIRVHSEPIPDSEENSK